MKKQKSISWPALLVELDTTGIGRDDSVIHVVCNLVQASTDGTIEVCGSYRAYQASVRESSHQAFAVHGLSSDMLFGRSIDVVTLGELVAGAGCIISRNPKFTAKKLHALVPECLNKLWYEYPAHIQGYPGKHFPANERMQVLLGNVESFGYGRRHELTELLGINAEHYTLVFDEDGPPEVLVRFGRRKVLNGFAEAMLKCGVGTRFRLHGSEGYDFITGYCNEGPAYRERAFRLATTPSNLALVRDHHLDVYLDRIDGLTYDLAVRR